MKTLSAILITLTLVILYGFVHTRPIDGTGKTPIVSATPTQEMIITRKPVVTRSPTVTPNPYPGYP